MENIEIAFLNNENEKDFYALAAEYLPGSNQDKMKKYASMFPKLFLALTFNGEVIGVAFGWHRKIDFPDDDSFTLDGIAVKYEYEKRGYGKILLNAFEKSAKEYGGRVVSVGSAGGYVERFYISCGYIPKEYKVWDNGSTAVEEVFESIDEYYTYDRKTSDGFVVMEKKIGVLC